MSRNEAHASRSLLIIIIKQYELLIMNTFLSKKFSFDAQI